MTGAIFEGRYILHCISCYGKNFHDTKQKIKLEPVNQTILEQYQELHDVIEHHDVILVHESRLPKYVLKNIHGDKKCQKIAL